MTITLQLARISSHLQGSCSAAIAANSPVSLMIFRLPASAWQKPRGPSTDPITSHHTSQRLGTNYPALPASRTFTLKKGTWCSRSRSRLSRRRPTFPGSVGSCPTSSPAALLARQRNRPGIHGPKRRISLRMPLPRCVRRLRNGKPPRSRPSPRRLHGRRTIPDIRNGIPATIM